MTTQAKWILALALLSMPLVACGGTDAAEDVDGEDLSEEAITNHVARVAGSYVASQATSGIRSLTLRSDRTFEASVARACAIAPCPHERVLGRFRVGSKNLYLDQPLGGAPSSAYGTYAYSLRANTLTLSRSGQRSMVLTRQTGLVPSDATKLGATAKGGMTRPLPGGSTCNPNDRDYALDLRTRVLTYKRCSFDERLSSFDPIQGTVQVSAQAVANIRAEYEEASISNRDVCGMDKPEERITVTTPAGTKTYLDEFYSCRQGRGTYVTNVDAIIVAFDALVPMPL